MEPLLANLRVYRRATELGAACWDSVRDWESFPMKTVGAQLVRAADSVGANIAEGFGRGSPRDNRRFLHMARGSLYEARHFALCARRRGLLSDENWAKLSAILAELIPSLNAYIRAVTVRCVSSESDDVKE